MAQLSLRRYAPVTAVEWPALQQLFGERGACGGCWCMTWRLRRKQFEAQKGEANRRALQQIVERGPPPGVLAFENDAPIGWCAIAPRSELLQLERSRVLKRIDERPVWSVSCLFVARPFRRRGVSTQLLRAAAAFAQQSGAEIIEGYPVIPSTSDMPAVFAWTGTYSAFIAAGFAEVARHSPTRPIMRLFAA